MMPKPILSLSTLIIVLLCQEFCGSMWLPKMRWNKTCDSDKDCEGPPFDKIARYPSDVVCAPQYCALHSWSSALANDDSTNEDGVLHLFPTTSAPLNRTMRRKLSWKIRCTSDEYYCRGSPTFIWAANNDTEDIYCSARYCALKSWPRS